MINNASIIFNVLKPWWGFRKTLVNRNGLGRWVCSSLHQSCILHIFFKYFHPLTQRWLSRVRTVYFKKISWFLQLLKSNASDDCFFLKKIGKKWPPKTVIGIRIIACFLLKYPQTPIYNQFHNILRLLDILPNFPFTTSETMCDHYL